MCQIIKLKQSKLKENIKKIIKKCQKYEITKIYKKLSPNLQQLIYLLPSKIMLSQYAHAKLQSAIGQEYFIHSLPAIIGSKKSKQITITSEQIKIQILPITNILTTFHFHAIIFYQSGSYYIASVTPLCIDGKEIKENSELINQIKQNNEDLSTILVNYIAKIIESQKQKTSQMKQESKQSLVEQTYWTILKPISRIIIKAQDGEVYYFCLPSQNQQRNIPQNPIQNNKQPISLNVPQKAPITHINGSKWSNDDHEQLKKLLLQYGYGRWKQIQRSSASIGSRLSQKPLPEVKAYASGFLRALGLSIPQQETNLKIFLQKLIEQNQEEYNQYQPNLKQWENHIMLPQRSIQYTKRLQLLQRVKNLIRKYRQDSMKNMQVPDRRKVNWDGLLNFIPLGLLFGQRPAVWWAKKNDIDLLLGIYKYGYANYVSIRSAKQYGFSQLEKAQAYQDFPVADNLTRRLKKLINTIVKIQQNQGQIDFDDQAESEQDQKLWTEVQKKGLFNLVSYYGVPVGADNKSNWTQLKDKLKNDLKDFSKSPSQVQKMVSRLRWNCQQIISDQKLREQGGSQGSNFKISYQMAAKFSKNINILEFIRKSIVTMQAQNQKTFFLQVDERSSQLSKEHPAYIDAKAQDQNILNHVNKNGITIYPHLKLNQTKVLARMQWLCQIYKIIKQKVQDKKKKYKTFDESTKKKAKFQLNRDKEGNIKFPININPSLILVATGTICTTPNYHSQHNLFPIGYISIRTHASMFTKGMRCKYRCEILEGDGKPVYKVTSQEDAQNPIIKDSSTGCWVYICNKVNQLQEIKKQKVTISGTQRFGLLQPNVVRLLQDLPNAQKCTKYKFKKNIPKQQQ